MNKPERLYVERLANGKYAVKEAHNKEPLTTANTQAKAIAKAEKINPKEILVERVRFTNNGSRDKWRKL